MHMPGTAHRQSQPPAAAAAAALRRLRNRVSLGKQAPACLLGPTQHGCHSLPAFFSLPADSRKDLPMVCHIVDCNQDLSSHVRPLTAAGFPVMLSGLLLAAVLTAMLSGLLLAAAPRTCSWQEQRRLHRPACRAAHCTAACCPRLLPHAVCPPTLLPPASCSAPQPEYYQRYRICKMHLKSPALLVRSCRGGIF